MPDRYFFRNALIASISCRGMNTSAFIDNELRNLEIQGRLALEQIHRSTTIREVIAGMNVPVPAMLRSLRNSVSSLSRIERTAYGRAESIVRAQLAALAQEEDEQSFLRHRGRLMTEWRQIQGRFPRLANFIQVESERLRAKYRAPLHITAAPGAVIHS